MEMRDEHVVDVCSVWVHAFHVAGDPLAGVARPVRQKRQCKVAARRRVEVAAVEEHRRSVREYEEHRFARARVDEVNLKMPLLPATELRAGAEA